MRNKKTLIILAVVLVALIVATVLVTNIDVHREKVRAEEGTLMQFKGDDVTEFIWRYDKMEYAFEKKDGLWISPDDESFPVQQDKVNNLLAQVQNFKTNYTIEKPDKLAAYGLKNPKCAITVKTKGTDYTIDFGDVSSMDGLRYTNVNDGNVYLATDDVMDKFNITVYDLLQYDTFPQCYKVTDFVIEGDNNLHIYYDKENHHGYSDEYLYYVKRGGSYLPLGTLDTSNFIGYFTGYQMVDYITFKIDDATLENYNLKNPELTITASYLLEESSTETESVKYYLSMAADNIAYIMKEGSSIIYRMDPKDYEYFANASYETLQAPELALLDPEDIDKMVVSMDGANYTVLFDHKANKQATVYTLNGEEIDLTETMKLLKKTACDDFETSAVGNKTISIRLYGSNGNYTSRLVEIYNSTAEHSVVKIDGQYFGRTTRKDALDLVQSFMDMFASEGKEESK